MFRTFLFLAIGLCFLSPVHAQGIAYVSGSSGEPWGMPGNVNTLNDVFGVGNWDRLDFPTAVVNSLFTYETIYMDGGNGTDAEFIAFIEANRSDLETWVAGGGKLLITAARWGSPPDLLDLGFGITLDAAGGHATGEAVDGSHAIYNGPFGATGTSFSGNNLSHDRVFGAGLIPLMYGSNDPDQIILGEMSYGSGHLIVGGLTLPWFGEHANWSTNSGAFHRNLFNYVHVVQVVPEPASSFGILLVSGLALLRRRRR